MAWAAQTQVLNALPANYQASDALWLPFQCRVEDGDILQITHSELGLLLVQPLQESYVKFGALATRSWITSLWKTCDNYKVWVATEMADVRFPLEWDPWLLKEFSTLITEDTS